MGCSCSSHKGARPPAPPPNVFLPHYTLASLNGRDVFGPFLKLRSHDPATGAHSLSALVVCSEAAQQRLTIPSPRLTWWDPDANPLETFTSTDAGAVTAPGAGVVTAVATAVAAAVAAAAGPQTGPADAPGELLFAWRDWRFWRFHFDVTCGKAPRHIRYQVDLVPEQAFTVALPARDQGWHWGFYSCNGLDSPDAAAKTGGVQPLWADLLDRHAQRPLHALVGGGDQLYNDGVFQGPLLQGWDRTLSAAATEAKIALPYSEAMRAEVEEFYFSHYCMHFGQPVLSAALASIPSINIWDDHDIFDGWGSYPARIQQAAVLQGIYRAAQLFYHLFQLHTTVQLAVQDGFWAGTSSLTQLGGGTALVLPDTRSFRTVQAICPPALYEELRGRLEALPPSVRHVVVVLTVPMLWPHLNVTKLLQSLSSEITRNKAVNQVLGLTGILRRLQLQFGEINVIDDLIDHWDTQTHQAERDRLLGMLIEVAAAKGFRVTLLSGDVHCAGYAVCHGRGGGRSGDADDMGMPSADTLARDPRFITQVVSSAIANIPPPDYVVKALEAEGESPKAILQDCVMRMRPPGRHFHLGGVIEDKDDFLVRQRNWCEVSLPDGPDGELLFSLRCEKQLGRGNMHMYDIRVPPLER